MVDIDKFKEPYNPLDPIVIIDPKTQQSRVIKVYEDSPGANQSHNINQETVDAIDYPLIKVNSHIIKQEQIESFILYYTGFLPTLYLVIKDIGKDIQYSDVPGLDNLITVVITMPVNGVYKKVSIDFYITKCDFWSTSIVIEATYKSTALEKTFCTQIGDGEISTYEMLKNIANVTGIGFAATENCKTIEDKQYRQCRSQKLKDFIKYQIEHSGTDETTVFDCWVDLNGYIILVNIPWVYTTEFDINQLVIFSLPILHSTVNDLDTPEDTVVMAPRILNNKTYGGSESNLSIKEYNSIVDTDSIKKNGALTNYWILTDPCVRNTLDYRQIQIIEESIDGQENSQNYEFENIVFLGTEMGGNLFQTKINESFKTKIKSKQLEVELKKINLGLQRGTVIGVEIFDYDSRHKMSLIDNINNVGKTEKDDPENDDSSVSLLTDDQKERLGTDRLDGVLNVALSGKYYIESMKFEYSYNSGQFKQFLYLSKIGSQSNIYNANTMTKIPIGDNE